MSGPAYETVTVAVEGGDLVAGVWGPPGAPIVLAPHGITGNHLQMADVAADLGADHRIVAPDLRGRGASASLPGPYSMHAHARDLIALLDAVAGPSATAVVLGHSMGGFVATMTASTYADRIERAVCVEGGIAIETPPGIDVDAVLLAVIGPAIERLSLTFESAKAYRDHWKAHPAFAAPGAWTPTVEAAIDYDLVGTPPTLRSAVSPTAVRDDAAHTLTEEVRLAIDACQCPVVFLAAEFGMLGAPAPGLHADDLLEDVAARVGDRFTWQRMPGVNHYTIALSADGAAAVAAVVRGDPASG